MTSDDNGWGNINDTTITYNSGGVPTEYTISEYIVGPLFWLAWTKDHTLIRKYEVEGGVTDNPSPYFVVDVQYDSVPKNTFDSLGFHNCNCNTSSINENVVSVTMDIYPNPVVNSSFTVEADDAITSIEMFDLAGRVSKRIVVSSNTYSKTIDLNSNVSGVLFVTVKFESGKTQTKKLLVK